uniref:Glutathione peroxidase n=1 Tax=Oryza meridionalis TaxID=40149 RepID=A0A0E0DY29_9ORYZ
MASTTTTTAAAAAARFTCLAPATRPASASASAGRFLLPAQHWGAATTHGSAAVPVPIVAAAPSRRWAPGVAYATAATGKSVHDFTVKDIDGKDVALSKFKGRALLIVNVASQCGLTTANYTELSHLYEKYKTQGFEILAFPCNQFGAQEPGSNPQIKQFACTRFKAEFPIFDKVDVNGPNTAPIYKFLKSSAGGFLGDLVKWNFEKFLAILTAIAVVAISGHAPPAASTAAGDRAALLSFSSGVHGNLSDWGSPAAAMCNWTGVRCDNHSGRVTGLLLSNSNLAGVISPAIANLSMLEKLYLDGNHLAGGVPPELGALSRLRELSLHYNLLGGQIPEALGRLTSVTYLTLDGNGLAGDIPEAIFCNCSGLTFIGMSGNSLTGDIPLRPPCRLPALRQLSLFGNALSGVLPPALSNCTALRWLLLQDNSLSGELPPEMFGSMPSLVFLYLSHNHFSSSDGNTNLEPFFSSLVNCTGLLELGVASAGVGGEIPAIIGNVSSANLSSLFLSGNRIAGKIPPAIGNLHNLTELCLFGNMLEGPIPPEILRPPRLALLDLSKNRIVGEIPRSVGESRLLETINLSQNKLKGTLPESLSNLTQLEHLVLHHNMLSGTIPPVLNCNLMLDLSYNKLTDQIPSEITVLGNFHVYLNLSNNLLDGHVPLQIGNMEMTQALDL